MANNQENIMELMANLVLALPGYNPLEIPSVSTAAAQRYALASMYKEKGFRDYMTKAIASNIARFQDVRDMYGLGVQQGRVLVLKELFNLAEQMFHEAEKIDKALKQ